MNANKQESDFKQGYFRDKDLVSEPADQGVMTPQEVDEYARAAESQIKSKSDELRGEGDPQAAESYNRAATDFARKQKNEAGERP